MRALTSACKHTHKHILRIMPVALWEKQTNKQKNISMVISDSCANNVILQELGTGREVHF